METSKLLDNLNNIQKEACIYTKGPLLILAGAGSGKTRVLTYKIAYLLEQRICNPWEIMAITFTNKAAKEMKERVEGLVGIVAKDIWMGTFHSVCVRILKREIEALGYTKNFNIIDEQDKQKILKDIMKKMNISDKIYPISSVIYEISSSKDKLIDQNQYIKDVSGDYRKENIGLIYKEYQKTLKRNDALDFDDIIFQTVKLFETKPDRLAYYQNKFKYVLVDEYQDTNHAQFVLISKLVAIHKNICVVGDESQSIYGFRGADISNILEFEKQYKDAKVIKLEQNYRSTKTILNAANSVINNNKSKLDKKLWTNNNEGEKIKYFTARNEYEEGGYIVETINTLSRKKEFSYKDFVILYRTNAQSRAIEEMFVREGVLYKIIGGTKFYARKEIKDIVAYLKLINNPNDNVSLTRIINEPKRGIGESSIEKLNILAQSNNNSMFNTIDELNEDSKIRCYRNIIEFKLLIDSIASLKNEMSISQLIEHIIDKTGYKKSLLKEKNMENESRLENIYEFLGVAIEFETENAENSLKDFLESIALIAEVDSLDENNEAVTLMTMHNAKGLEYPVVFLAGMEEGLFPSYRNLQQESELEEERRLCYVGITRAMKSLYITNAKQRTLYGNTTCTMPSRFLEEIPERLFDEFMKENNKNINTKDMVSYNDKEYASSQRKINSSFMTYKKQTINSQQKPSNITKVGIDVNTFLKDLHSNKKANNDNVNIDWIIEGSKVNHKRFGKGTVKNIEKENNDLKVEIVFEKVGMKRLMAKHAGLEQIK